MTNKILTVVIPVFNKWRYTAHCLASLFHSSIDKDKYEVLIVDNASTDMTPTLLSYLQKENFPINILRNEENLGYLLGANQGWKEVKTPYCLHLNNDVFVKPDTIELMLKPFQKDPLIGIVGGIQISVEKPINYAYETKHYFHTYFYRGEDVDKNDDIVYVKPLSEEEKQRDYVEVESTGFGCAIVKKEVWEKVGFYDERFVPCMSEMEDYLLRTKEAGFKICISPKALYLHAVGATTVDNRPYFDSIVKRNKLLFKEKWGEKLRRGEI
jgi:GT2 family glycosyltransferase